MASAPSRRRKAPITAHPAFPGIVALWFAVLLGAGSLVVPVALWERIVAMLGVDGVLAAAAPPLGIKARAIIALVFAVLGALAGLAIARRMAPPRGRVAEDAVEDEHATETLGAFIAEDLSSSRDHAVDEEEDVLLFSAFDDVDAPDEPLPEFEKPGEPPVFVVPEELAADPISDEAVGETVAEEEFAPEAEIYQDFAPKPVRFVEDIPAQPETAHSLRAPEQLEDESLADLAARLQEALRRRRAAQAPVAPLVETSKEPAPEAEAAPPVAADAKPFEDRQSVGRDEDSDALPLEDAPSLISVAKPEEQADAEDWSDGPREDTFAETSVPPVPEPDNDLVVAKGRAQLPQAFLEADFPAEDAEFAEFADFDESLSLPIARADGLRVTFATLADDLLDDPPIEAGEEDEEYDEDEGTSYGSLLGMKGPYFSGAPRDSDEDWDDEDDLSAYPQPVFDDEEPEEMAVEADEDLVTPFQDLGEPEEPAPPARAPLSREEQDAALRDALLGLQRFSGAA